MDFSWMPSFGMFWIFPLLCLLFMAFMMIGCGGMLFRFRHGGRHGDGRETPFFFIEWRQTPGCCPRLPGGWTAKRPAQAPGPLEAGCLPDIDR